MSKQKGFYAEFVGPKKQVVYLQSYYFQGGKWYPLQIAAYNKLGGKNGKRRKSS